MRRITLSLVSVLGFAIAGNAGAVSVSSQECAPTGDNRTITIDPGLACIAKGEGNNVNNSVFQAAVSGWLDIGTEEDGVVSSLFDVNIGQSTGQLTLANSLWQDFDEILVVLKVGNKRGGTDLNPDWALFSLESNHTVYNWSVVPTQGGALSHATLYGRSSVGVPEPGSLGLMGLGLLGVAAYRRRKAK